MPAGIDFVCQNEECEHCGKGITITAPWPMGDINKVMDAPNVAKKEDFRRGLLKLKTEGHKYACITYPNIDEIETLSYRVHKWCPNCPCVWMYDADFFEDDKTLEEILNDADIPSKCSTCGEELMDFNAILEEGVLCPFCKEEMHKDTWFCNETTKEVG